MDWIIRELLKLPTHMNLEIEKSSVPHPLEMGFQKSIGEWAGQKADYRLALLDWSCIHSREYENYYLFHRDARDPRVDPVGHLIIDAPHWISMIVPITIVLTSLAATLYLSYTREQIITS